MFNSVMLDRKSFISGALAVPLLGGCRSFGCRNRPPRRIKANEKVNVGVIGCGLIAKGTNVPGFLKDPRCRVTVACDMVKVAPGYFYGAKPKDGAKSGIFEGDISYSSKVPRAVRRLSRTRLTPITATGRAVRCSTGARSWTILRSTPSAYARPTIGTP